MIGLLPTTTIFLATAPTDLRKAYDGLAVLVRQSLGQDDPSGCIRRIWQHADRSVLGRAVSSAVLWRCEGIGPKLAVATARRGTPAHRAIARADATRAPAMGDRVVWLHRERPPARTPRG